MRRINKMYIFKKLFTNNSIDKKIKIINERLATLETLLLYNTKRADAVDKALVEVQKLTQEIMSLTDLVGENRHMIVQISHILTTLMKSIPSTVKKSDLEIGELKDILEIKTNKGKLPN